MCTVRPFHSMSRGNPTFTNSTRAISLLSPSKNMIGLQEYLVVYGEARVTEGGAVPLLQRLARIYMGPDADFPPAELRDRPGFVTRIAPRRFAGRGTLEFSAAVIGCWCGCHYICFRSVWSTSTR